MLKKLLKVLIPSFVVAGIYFSALTYFWLASYAENHKYVEEKKESNVASSPLDDIVLKRNFNDGPLLDLELRTVDTAVSPTYGKYDGGRASVEMKQEMLELYAHSKESLEKIAVRLTEKYKMSISTSTISKLCRDKLNLRSRREGNYLKI